MRLIFIMIIEMIIYRNDAKISIIDIITRQASLDYTFRNSQLTIPKSQVIHIPVYIYSIHFDPDIYPKPEIYDPERFDEATRFRRSMHYMPFGFGPRNCIGT